MNWQRIVLNLTLADKVINLLPTYILKKIIEAKLKARSETSRQK